MLSDTFELQTPQAKEWPLIPADVYQTEITKIEEKIEPNKFKNYETDPDEVKRINFEFTIIEEGPHYGRRVWQKMAPVKPYPPTAKGKETWLYRLASAMAGHSITRGEADKFGVADVNGYLSKQIRVTVKHSVPNAQGKQYANVDSFLPAKVQLPPFDEAKVPKENQPAEPKGYEKFKAVAETLPVNNETVDLGGIKVEDIPFN